jgi:hypothetical protein
MSDSERVSKRGADLRLASLRWDEESKWAQRAKVKYIQQGEIIENTSI